MINLPKRKEIKAKIIKSETADSYPEWLLNHELLRHGLRARKQLEVGPFFADLAFPEHMIAIEYDGPQHMENLESDYKRQKYFESQGWKVFRIISKGNKVYELTEDFNEFGVAVGMESAINMLAGHLERLFKEKEFSSRMNRGELHLYSGPEKIKGIKFRPVSNFLEGALDRIEKRMEKYADKTVMIVG